MRSARCSSATGKLQASALAGVKADHGTVGNLVRGAGFQSGSDEAIAEHAGELGLSLGHSQAAFYCRAAWRKTRKMSLVAASSLGKWPLARTARRSLAFKASIVFVV